MVAIQRFEDLEAWKHARQLTNEVYDVTLAGDFSRDFGRRDQIRRASISIVSNIAEGYERDGDREFLQFLHMPKALAAKSMRNFISRMMGTTCHPNNLMRCRLRQSKRAELFMG
jgi:hypothetical protein